MKDMSAPLTPAEMKALGEFFEKKKVHAHLAGDPELAAVGRYIYLKGNPYSGVTSCTSCHGLNGAGTPHLARLAGQQPLHTETQLKQFNKRERTNDNAVMHSIASKLTELESKAVAEYISTLE
jgi:cytochrome c553